MEGKEYELGRRLKSCRKRIGLKQEEVGRKIGIGKSMVSDWECGKRVPSVSLLMKLAALYEVPLEVLVDVQNAADGETAAERLSNFVMSDSPEEVAAYLNISVNSLSRMTAGDLDITQEQAEKLAERYGVQPSLFLDEPEEVIQTFPSNVRPISNLHHQRVPLIGEVAAGEPIYAPEDLGIYVDSPVDADAAITIRGDSMIPTYQDGDLVYIKARPDVPEGAVAVVFLDDEATLKHVYKRPTGLTLWSDNTAYAPMNIEFEDYNNVRIFGIPVGFTRIYKPTLDGKIRKGFSQEGKSK